jgi:hypothetical protein
MRSEAVGGGSSPARPTAGSVPEWNSVAAIFASQELHSQKPLDT